MYQIEDETWIEELREEQIKDVRRKIVSAINRAAKRQDLPYGVIWNGVYSRLTGRTGLCYQPVRGSKLNHVQECGHLGDLLAIANQL